MQSFDLRHRPVGGRTTYTYGEGGAERRVTLLSLAETCLFRQRVRVEGSALKTED